MRRPNKKGCIPSEDVCLEHDEPLMCKHGCNEAIKHACSDYEPNAVICDLCLERGKAYCRCKHD